MSQLFPNQLSTKYQMSTAIFTGKVSKFGLLIRQSTKHDLFSKYGLYLRQISTVLHWFVVLVNECKPEFRKSFDNGNFSNVDIRGVLFIIIITDLQKGVEIT